MSPAAAASPSSEAAARHTVARVYSYTRTAEDSALAVRVYNGSAGFSTAPTAIWLLDDQGVLVSDPILFVLPAGTAAPKTNATGSEAGCRSLPAQPELVCESRAAGYVALQLKVTNPAVHRVVVGLVGDDRVINVGGPARNSGWRGGLTRGRLQLLRATDVSDLYVSSNSQTIEHFSRATLTGGVEGSLAVAAAACRDAAGVKTGHGSASLTGSTKATAISCDLNGTVVTGAYAPRRTTWTLAGDIWATNYTAEQITVATADFVSYTAQDVRLMVASGPF
jgi:hypothetical protein